MFEQLFYALDDLKVFMVQDFPFLYNPPPTMGIVLVGAIVWIGVWIAEKVYNRISK